MRLAEACQQTGRDFHIVRLRGFAERGLGDLPGEDAALGEVGAILKSLNEAGCGEVVLAGTVRRPDFAALRPDWRGARLLPRVLAAAAKGDGALLALLVATFEEEGFTIVGADDVMADLLVPSGPLAGDPPEGEALSDIVKAAALIDAIGPFDVGQAAVVCGGHVLAVEAAEGTDAMLSRCAGFDLEMRGAAGDRRGVLVKRPKPGQERRVDLPTIGARTIDLAASAGLAGVAVEAQATLFLDREEALVRAEQQGLFVFGFTSADLVAAETPTPEDD